jgi:D-glucosaminate-6-phosphate ammonia-lyase
MHGAGTGLAYPGQANIGVHPYEGPDARRIADSERREDWRGEGDGHFESVETATSSPSRRSATAPKSWPVTCPFPTARGWASRSMSESWRSTGFVAELRSQEEQRMDVYARLQVRTVINAFETVSIVGGTRIRPEALAAMQAAAGSFVFLPELQEKVGERIARLTRNEAAVVTNGALAGMLLATVACLSRGNPGFEHPLLLPYGGRRNRVIVQRCQYSPYLPNITQVGAELVEVGYSQQQTPDHVLEVAFDELTAAVFYTAGRPYERFATPLERVVEIAHERGVPVIVDGAALLPPPENLWRYTQMGADLVVFSGGKGLRGPQDSGVVVGKRDLVERIHRVNSPTHGLGRALKTTKEDIVGFLVALELALEEDQAARYEALQERAQRISRALAESPGSRPDSCPTDGRASPARGS